MADGAGATTMGGPGRLTPHYDVSEAGKRAPNATNLNEDPEMEGLSLYEKKALLVNRELDRQGMGRYQWYVFFLCGFGYFLDLLWAQAFGLAVIPMQPEFGFSDVELGNIFTSFSAGLTAGACESSLPAKQTILHRRHLLPHPPLAHPL
jgi:hypothetical protein